MESFILHYEIIQHINLMWHHNLQLLNLTVHKLFKQALTYLIVLVSRFCYFGGGGASHATFVLS